MKRLSFSLLVFSLLFCFSNFASADTTVQPICKVDKTTVAPNDTIFFTPSMPSSSETYKYKFIGEASTTSTGRVAMAFIYPGEYTIALSAIAPNGTVFSSLCPKISVSLTATSSGVTGGSFYPYPFASSTLKAQIPKEVVEPQLGCFNLIQNLSFGYYDDVKMPSDGVIYKLQNYLKSNGYLKVAPTGYFGPATKAAVKAIQLDNDIEPTGFVGPLTRAMIKKLSCGI